MTDIFLMPDCRAEAITLDGPDLLHVDARGTRPGGGCPACGHVSRAIHSRYRRRPADLPSIERRVYVGLRVRLFYCRNAKCARRTFAERLPDPRTIKLTRLRLQQTFAKWTHRGLLVTCGEGKARRRMLASK